MRIIDEKIEIENPTCYASRVGDEYSQFVNRDYKKEYGQFYTPIEIAQYMGQLSECKNERIKILDPGCGCGILSCALIEQLISKTRIESIDLTVYEIDEGVLLYTQKIFDYLNEWCKDKGIKFSYNIFNNDFLVSNIGSISSESFLKKEDRYDIVISNPPYFKWGKNDTRYSIVAEHVSNIPNIYVLFLMISAELLKEEGELIFINPRSFTAGFYFKAFREFFLKKMDLNFIHLFASRTKTFKKDKVLQETLIIRAKKNTIHTNNIEISTSEGIDDLSMSLSEIYNKNKIIDLNSINKTIFLPVDKEESNVIELINSQVYTLEDLGIKVSTGPVVNFRSKDYIVNSFSSSAVPLYWMHNVEKMELRWPLEVKNRGQYILFASKTEKQLVANNNLVLLRRFSTKDDSSRLIAAPFLRENNKCRYIGIENKLNYIYKNNGELGKYETIGISALLNSDIYNMYFKTFNGNINVSATEIRMMKFPSIDIISEIGKKITKNNAMNFINEIVTKYIKA